MKNTKNEYFGGPTGAFVQRKSELLWSLVKDNPRYCCHGRGVGLAGLQDDSPAQLVALAGLIGVGVCDWVPDGEVGPLLLQLKDVGLATDHMEVWNSTATTLDTAREIIASRGLPAGVELVFVDPETPKADLDALDEFTQAHGALLPMGSFLRGIQRPSVCVYGRDRQGLPVGSSAAGGHFHKDHPKANTAFWGMLATREDHRGLGLALFLGAQAIVEMHERHGFTGFFTAIKHDNTASKNLCAKLGLEPTGTSVVFAIDTGVLP